MKRKDGQTGARLAPAMVEDRATERLKKRAQDLGLIVNAGAGKAGARADRKKGVAREAKQRQ